MDGGAGSLNGRDVEWRKPAVIVSNETTLGLAISFLRLRIS